jgi:outer membrane lipoprotein SlyB
MKNDIDQFHDAMTKDITAKLESKTPSCALRLPTNRWGFSRLSEDETPDVLPLDHSPSMLSRRIFIVSGITLLAGCAGMGKRTTTMECRQLQSGGDQMACLNRVMFPEIVERAATGAAIGAVLGGIIYFAITRDSRHIVKAIAYGAVGGAVVSGVAAYYDLVLREANSDPVRAYDEVASRALTDAPKFEAFSRASTVTFEVDNRKLETEGPTGGTVQQINEHQRSREKHFLSGKATLDVLLETAEKLLLAQNRTNALLNRNNTLLVRQIAVLEDGKKRIERSLEEVQEQLIRQMKILKGLG